MDGWTVITEKHDFLYTEEFSKELRRIIDNMIIEEVTKHEFIEEKEFMV